MSRHNVIPWIVISASVVILLLALLSFGCDDSTSDDKGGAPDFTLSTPDGESITLSDFRGQTVLLNFWATWCASCTKDMPNIQDAFERRGHDVQFIGINIGESSDTVKKYTNSKGIGFTTVLDTNGKVADSFNIKYTPTTILIDEQGIIQYMKIGTFNSAESILAALEGL